MFENVPDNGIDALAGREAALVDDEFVGTGRLASEASVLSPEILDRSRRLSCGKCAYRACKRIFDAIFSLIVIAFLFAPASLLCLLICIESKGSPIYRQRRVGRWGQPLNIYKLRTMVSDSDDVEKYLNEAQMKQWQHERKVVDDPRITRVGCFLRKTSLDELPQFFNVLSGSMSVVGVRPVVVEELAAYGDELSEFLSVKPGITGWWQVTARNDAIYSDGSRQELELFYARNASLGLDAKVFFGTFKAMFGKTGR